MSAEHNIDEGVTTGLGNAGRATIREYVGLPINELFACGLLCEFRPGLVAKTYPVKEADRRETADEHAYILDPLPGQDRAMDANVHVSVIPWKISREELRRSPWRSAASRSRCARTHRRKGRPSSMTSCAVSSGAGEALPESGVVEYDD